MTAITPGPANLCSLAAAMRYGKRAALRQWRGLFLGYFLDAMGAVFVTYLLGAALNDYVGMLSWVGAIYIFWLAFHMLRSSGTEAEENPAAPSFGKGILVQLTNVKVIVSCLTALTSFVLPYTRSFWHLLAVGLFLPLTGPVANLMWLFAGAGLKNLFAVHGKAVDRCMAGALILCAINLVRPR